MPTPFNLRLKLSSGEGQSLAYSRAAVDEVATKLIDFGPSACALGREKCIAATIALFVITGPRF